MMYVDPDGEWFQWALMAVGAFFGGQAAYNASNGNLFATLAGAIAGGFIGYNAGMGLETALTNAGISQNLGFSFEYAGAQVNATVLSGYGGQLSAGFGLTGGAAGAVGFASLLAEQKKGMGGHGPALDFPSLILDNSSRNVYAVESGYIYTQGWQNDLNHNEGFGYRVYIRNDETGFEHVYGHMEPSSIKLKKWDSVSRGQYIGKYASPTNGRSSGPHVHIGMRRIGTGGPNSWLNPGLVSPLRGGSISSPFHSIDSMHTDPHLGVDYAY